MRGEILQYDDNAGTGLISGDDGVRYQFSRSDMRELRALSRGTRVDFVPQESGRAGEIYILQSPGATSALLEGTNEDLDLWGYFAKAMRKSFDGEGRARRKEYWSFVLFSLLFMIGGVLVVSAFGAAVSYSAGYDVTYEAAYPFSILAPIALAILLFVFVPAHITVTIRRLHDIGMTGWWILILLLPYLGSLIILICTLIPSERRVNKHGLYPKPVGPLEAAAVRLNEVVARRSP
jgi:uncharacterized membrane protein YhaH (DUF805 family)